MSNFIICPVCGFSFQVEFKKKDYTIKCPMCGHEFNISNIKRFRSQ